MGVKEILLDRRYNPLQMRSILILFTCYTHSTSRPRGDFLAAH
jgi:hypothetical protein